MILNMFDEFDDFEYNFYISVAIWLKANTHILFSKTMASGMQDPTTLPLGPRTLDELLFGHGAAHWQRLSGDLQCHVIEACEDKLLCLGSFYSGWDAYALGASQTCDAASLRPPYFFRASELVPERRQFILAHPPATRPRHLFGQENNKN